MAKSNHDRIGTALELLNQGLTPFVERELQVTYGTSWKDELQKTLKDYQIPKPAKGGGLKWDVQALLSIMWNHWNDTFKRTLGHAERSLVNELQGARNKWAHQETFSSDDAYRGLDSATRLLTAVSAPQAEEAEKMKMELLRVRFDEQMRTEKRKSAGTAIESQATGNLKPWREVVNPHKDVASGKYQQAEFAADLWQVHLGEGGEEYRKPVEFFRRTYLTESLKRLLVGAVERVSAKGGDPVVQLQTNFGGGKTHSMLALYHLLGGTPPAELAGVDDVLKAAEVEKLPRVNRVVLVGNKISPGNPVKKADGTEVRTLWGELAWQLGYAAGGSKEAKKAFKRVQADDENATSPGDVLRDLFNDYGPCLVLIDEWVAYARQLHDSSDLPAGSFETQFSFAQVLTESAKLAKNCLLVISLPASDMSGSPHAQSDDVEVGGQRGREALDRLRNVIGRVESSWRPASAEEGFEIVRRRLFEPLIEREQFVARDTVAREFFDMYRTQQAEFPPDSRESDYEDRLKHAYPIHPEVFDRLYGDWSTLVKFQRTRGVLRLMAAVIHSLWEKGDRNPLIMPANIPIDDPRVQFELTRYLSDNWVPVIAKDVDGPNSLPMRIDAEVQNLGRFAACRRVARTIYMGSAPTGGASNRGLEDRRVNLGCVMPGEKPSIFGDALRRLSAAATYLYPDGNRYWYSTQPTVTKLAEDRAERYKRNTDAVVKEIEDRVREDVRREGDFCRVHPLPDSGQDVPDDMDARLVVLRTDAPYSKEPNCAAITAAKAILEMRGNAPRLFRNTLVFLAVDKSRLQDLDEAVRHLLAWESILNEHEELDLTAHQVKQAETQRKAADSAVTARMPEAYAWLLVPTQNGAQGEIEWQAFRMPGTDPLAVRASKKLRNDELLITSFAATRLRMELDRVPLWRGNHVEIKQLVDDFAKYLYLPRLQAPEVLLGAIRDGLGLLTWQREAFAYADSYDEAAKRYRGLRTGQNVSIRDSDAPGLLVKPEVATTQAEAESAKPGSSDRTKAVTGQGSGAAGTGTAGQDSGGGAEEPAQPKRFYGTVELDAARVGRDAGRIADEVISHLTGLVGAKVKVTLEIAAEVPDGAPENVVRIVTENARTLKFTSQGFEEE
ncbi:MAG: Swt1 family HEPN domain-containing protein [Planctomycetota bacterium]|nr:Swt1 family HEPN domain-containing protein [Planctomycetota bacterium]